MAYEIEPVTEGNVDTPLTVFPTGVDTFPRMSDVSITTLPLVLQYNAYYQSGNITAANQLVLNNPDLAYCMFTAKGQNELRDAVIAIEYYLLNQVDTLYNEVAQSAIGVNDNPNEEEMSIVSYSAEKVNSLFDVKYITLPLSGWSLTSPYTQTINVDGVESTFKSIISCNVDSATTLDAKKRIQKSWNFIDEIEIGDGTITATCKFQKPVVDVPIVIKGI